MTDKQAKIQAGILKRIAKGHFIVLKKAVPKKKSPTGKGEPAVKQRVAGCTSKNLLGKTEMKAMGGASAGRCRKGTRPHARRGRHQLHERSLVGAVTDYGTAPEGETLQQFEMRMGWPLEAEREYGF